MTFYQRGVELLKRYIPMNRLMKWGMNYSPMYRRTSGKIIFWSADMSQVRIQIKHHWKNKNFVGSIFGGSLFGATDPIYMMQYLQMLGQDYVAWDKSSEIKFIKPAYEKVYADFKVSQEEIEEVKKRLEEEGELSIDKQVDITDFSRQTLYCVVYKRIYVARKDFYKEKLKQKSQAK